MMEGIEITNQDKIRILGEKETYKYLLILEAIPPDKRRKKKFKKRIPQEN